MPSKKKKYNARFPAGRIKKIMQTDEEVGKVAQAVPVIISRTLELFVESLLTKSMQITQSRNAKTLTPSHMKQCILSESRFDFLKDLVKNIPDASVQEDNENNALFGTDAKNEENDAHFDTTAAAVRTEELNAVFEVSVKAAEASTSEVGLSQSASTISSNNHSKKASAYFTKRSERTSRRSSSVAAAAAAPTSAIVSAVPPNFLLTTTTDQRQLDPSTGLSRMPVIQYGAQVAKLAETKKLTDFSVNSLIDQSPASNNNNSSSSSVAQSMTIAHGQNNITVTVGAQSVVPVESFRVVQQQQHHQGSLKRKHSLDSNNSFISVLPPAADNSIPSLAPISSSSSSHHSFYNNSSQNEADSLCIDEDYDN